MTSSERPGADGETGRIVPLEAQAHVVKLLEEDIIFGRLPPGTRLIEDSLMARFKVTRHFIRQALQQLEKMGIVTREKNKGAAVRSLSLDEVHQIYEVREMLQRQAAMLIRLPAPDSLIVELERIHHAYCRHVETGNHRGVHEMNDCFHLTMFGACGNAYLLGSIKYYMWLSLPVRAKSMLDRDSLLLSRDHHALMLRQLQGRDHWWLGQLCVEHLQPSKAKYLERWAAGSGKAMAS